jgi:hypothetical protein
MKAAQPLGFAAFLMSQEAMKEGPDFADFSRLFTDFRGSASTKSDTVRWAMQSGGWTGGEGLHFEMPRNDLGSASWSRRTGAP